MGRYIVLVLLLVLLSACTAQKEEFKLEAQNVGETDDSLELSGAANGWSVKDGTKAAVTEMLMNAKSKLEGDAKYAFVVYTDHHDATEIQHELLEQLGRDTKIHGISSFNAVMTNEGLHKSEEGSIAVMLVSSDNVEFGVGSADLEGATDYEEMGRNTIKQAIADAGKTESDEPRMVIFSGTWLAGDEGKILRGIESVIGNDVPITGGNARKTVDVQSLITDEDIYEKGLVLTVIYTHLPVGWDYESQFKLVEGKNGIITKAEKNMLYEIDGRPALDVYDEWLDGKISEGIEVGDFTALTKFAASNSIAREIIKDGKIYAYGSVRPVINEANVEDGSIRLGTSVENGDKIHLMVGTWQTVFERAEKIPQKALAKGGMGAGDGLFGILTTCTGLTLSIPESELPRIPVIIEDNLNGIPFVGQFTGGEQGYVEGYGNINANLVQSIILVGK
ncbi:FIST signal transduction protein [Nanoarchaeota archaeon]